MTEIIASLYEIEGVVEAIGVFLRHQLLFADAGRSSRQAIP